MALPGGTGPPARRGLYNLMEPVYTPITINGIEFLPDNKIPYKNDYVRLAEVIETPKLWHTIGDVPRGTVLTKELVEQSLYRKFILDDLWFIIYFVIGIKAANHPFVVKQCKVVENGPRTNTLDVWARFHWKSTIITISETAQYHLRLPEECSCIFSYKKPAAEDFLDAIRKIYEKPIIKFAFSDVVYQKPESEAPTWSLQGGITLRRKNTARKEKTVEASGLVEGMVTGSHFERRIYDDIETDDIKDSNDELEKVFSKFDMSSYLGTGQDTDIERVVGTFYSHSGPLVKIMDKKTADGSKAEFVTRIMPGTVGGEYDGKPVLMSQQRLEQEKTKEHYASQILCDPTPGKTMKLNPAFLIEIEPEMIPRNVINVLLVDPAGDEKGKGGSDWAIELWGVEPNVDNLGQSNVYLKQAIIEELKEAEAPEVIARMYLAGGIIQKVGVEKVAQSTAEIHVASALAVRGRYLSTEDGSLVILSPRGRPKPTRISSNLAWPLNNSKVHISKAVSPKVRQRIRDEMTKFPVWKMDGIDCAAYLWDIIHTLNLAMSAGDRDVRFVRPGFSRKTSVA